MVLVDTCVWIGHMRQSDPVLQQLLEEERVMSHEYVVGELLCGRLPHRRAMLQALEKLEWIPTLAYREFRAFVGAQNLSGSGLGFVDAHLLGSMKLVPGVTLLTHDKRLESIYERTFLH